MGHFIDLTGARFGRLAVIGLADKKGSHQRWLCQCDCGKQTKSLGFSLRGGKSQSCGCIAAEKSKARWENPTAEMRARQSLSAKKTHGKTKHPSYQVWADMKGRCLNQKHKWFPSYGGRGITVCERWMSFENFYEDIGANWAHGMQLGRIDNDKGYSPENCRWETPEQQQSNKSNNVFIDTEIGRLTVGQAARHYGISPACLGYRVRSGYPAEKLFKPSQRSSK